MTNKAKDLVFQNLSMRLPYRIKCRVSGHKKDCILIGVLDDSNAESPSTYLFNVVEDDPSNPTLPIFQVYTSEIKPLLRSIKSLTEEEKWKLEEILCELRMQYFNNSETEEFSLLSASMSAFEIKFYLEHNIDFNGLIELNLAEEVSD